MTTDIGELRARLSLEAQQFRQGMEQTRSQMSLIGSSAKDTNSRFQALGTSLHSLGVSSNQIEKINERIKKANPQILQQMLNDVRTELQGIGMDSSEIEKITAEIEQAESGTMSFEETLTSIQTAAAAVGAGVVAAIGVSVKTAQEFEAQMSRVKAISGATDEEFKALEKSALDLGASTSKSASEVAIGFENMAAMGMNANDIIAAMPGVIAAAEASGSDMAQTADVMASALNIFGLKASEATKVADILAKTANISAASLDDMQYALKYAGPPAAALGISLEELSASIGIMTNAGMGGEQAGTTLRAALLGLLDPSDENSKRMEKMGIAVTDAKGNFVGLSKLIKNLSDSMKGQTETQKAAALSALVGTEAVSGMLSLMKAGPDTIDKMTKSLEESNGASAEAAKVMKDNLAGAYEELSGALETVQIKLGKEFLPLLTEVTKRGAAVVSSIAELDMATVKSGIAFAGTAAGIALVISTVGKLVIALKGLYLSMGPAGWLITGLSIVGGLFAAAAVKQRELSEVSLDHVEAMLKQHDALDESIKRYEELQSKSKLTNDEFARFVDINSELSKTADPTIIEKLKKEQDALAKKSGLSNEELNKMVELNGGLIEKVPEATKKISEQGNAILENTKKIKEYNAEQLKSAYDKLNLEKIKTETQYVDLLEREKKLVQERKDEETKLNSLMGKRDKAQVKANEEEAKLKDMMANSSEYSQAALQAQVEKNASAQTGLELLQKQLETQAGTIQGTETDLEKTRSKIKALEEIRIKMSQIVLSQVGLNSKAGEELSTINKALGKLEAKKKKLESTTPAAKRNTVEYREARDAIQEQINKLQTAKQQVEDIIAKAKKMNEELGKDVSKWVKVYVQEQKRISQNRPKSKDDALRYHTGGLVGHKPINQLHTGGLASQFVNMPSHNEVDVRLLRNEAVLTEAQQANLMRIIDEGNNVGSNNIAQIEPILATLRQQTSILSQILAKESNTYLDGKALYSSNKKHSNHESNLRNIFKGVNKS
jgi:TP901 family phage tail tape measure protein